MSNVYLVLYVDLCKQITLNWVFTIVNFIMFIFVNNRFIMKLETLQQLFIAHKEKALSGRYISHEQLVPLYEKLSINFNFEIIGSSVLGVPIIALKIGHGKKRLLMWSQMHGNESTTTKAVFDLCNILSDSKDEHITDILKNCTIAILPMLNPDGSKAYTRVNANNIDLNRDAQERTQPESVALREFFDRFEPDVCFNLHDQRTIYSAGKFPHPATVSFLSPSQDQECTITETRKKAMEIIVKMNMNLQTQIPDQVGIYDDAFNINCVGDTFQNLDIPTVLFEAGHFDEDYNREVVRQLILQSLIVAIHHVAGHTLTGINYKSYLDIPQNNQLFYDIIIRNAYVSNILCDIAIQYKEELKRDRVIFTPTVERISKLNDFFGHKEIDANGGEVFNKDGKHIYVGNEIDCVVINNVHLTILP